MPSPKRKCALCEQMVQKTHVYCRPCYQRWGRYLSLSDQGHGLGDTLTDDDCLAILMAMAKQARRAGEGMRWIIGGEE